ncbi:MAG: hypothetical protein JOZ72_06720 [Alphaproteobacteria bacterium]|nr:hypothetical protein [Alphaproteobacteria bacterium]
MVAQNLVPAIRKTVYANEGGQPYVLSYARKGSSGASFGFMQSDMHMRDDARDTMRQVLAAAGADQATVDRLVAALTPALPNGSPLSKADADFVNAALSSDAGKALVDAQDALILKGVLDNVDGCVAVAEARSMTMAPLALLYIAPWINMTGAPNSLKKWLGGNPLGGYPAPPAPPEVQGAQMEAYLKATKFFRENPRNFQHFSDCVAVGAKLLPA